MRITCAGGGPAGLYFAVLAKLADPAHEVTVVERNPAGVTYGWGVVFWDDLLDDLFRYDPVSARMIWEAAFKWDEYEVRATGKATTHLAGYGFSMGRRMLLDILAERATQLGVRIRYEDEFAGLDDFPDSDLVVACDGGRSRLRTEHESHHGTATDVGRNKYIWLGTPHEFNTFTFGFERTEAGWICSTPTRSPTGRAPSSSSACRRRGRRSASTGSAPRRAAPSSRRSSPRTSGASR